MDLQMITFVCFISWIDRTTDSWSMRRESVFDLILYVSFLKKERKSEKRHFFLRLFF